MSPKSKVQSPKSRKVSSVEYRVSRGRVPRALGITSGLCWTQDSGLRTRNFSRAFTLIEIMVVVLIMGITLTMSVPIAYKLWHRAPMRQAVKDIFEVCQNARRRAIFQGQTAELVFHPRERRLEVTGATGEGTSARLGDGVI